MTLRETVSKILKKEVTLEFAMNFANEQFGVLTSFIKGDFVSGFDDWIETYYEIVRTITWVEQTKDNSSIVAVTRNHKGVGGLYELAKELTDKFEKLYVGRDWNGEYYDKIEEFLKKELGECY